MARIRFSKYSSNTVNIFVYTFIYLYSIIEGFGDPCRGGGEISKGNTAILAILFFAIFVRVQVLISNRFFYIFPFANIADYEILTINIQFIKYLI